MASKGYYIYGGITLVELAIIVGLLGLVVVLTAPIYMTHLRLFSRQNAAIEVANQNRLALDDMVNQIRGTQSIVATCANCAGDTTSASTLVLQVWPINTSGEPFSPDGSGYDYIIYKIDIAQNQLIKKIIPDSQSTRAASSKIISGNVTTLQFTYNNADPAQASEVTIDLTNQLKAFEKTQTFSQTTKAVLRNK